MDRIPTARPSWTEDMRNAAIETLDSRQWVKGAKGREFGELFANYCGAESAVPCQNGSSSLWAALKILNIGPGDEVIVPSYTFISTVSAISLVGATPVFVDVEEDFWCIDYDSIQNALTNKTKAVIAVHIYGQIYNPEIIHLCKNNSIYLSDSGGQYYDGTTDITRTIILGKPSKEQIDRFTRVLKGHINLSNHTFQKGTKGTDIDYLARESLHEINCDYDHGTGHGIGSFLSVHEAPQRISKKSMFPSIELLPGMILSNEPGYYKEGEYGIRIENIIVVKEDNENQLKFENISWAPIDRELIDSEMLNEKELNWINDYHLKVFEKISGFLTLEEKNWLQKVTKPL